MAIRFLCPFGHRLMVPEHRTGRRGRCPICGQMVIVPVRNPEPSQREKRAWDAGGAQEPTVDPNVLATLGFSDDEGPQNIGAAVGSQFTVEEVPAHPTPLDLALTPGSQPQASPTPRPNASVPPATAVSTRVFAEGPDPEPVQTRAIPKVKAPAPPMEPGVVFEGLDELLGTVATTQASPGPGPAKGRPTKVIVIPPPPRAIGGTPLESSSVVVSTVPTVQAPPSIVAPARLIAAAPAAPLPARPARVDRHWIHTVYWLAFSLAAVTLFSAAPAMRNLNLLSAPSWASVMLLVATLQFAYIIWMVLVPDWSTVWVGMIVFAVVAAMYAVMALAAMLTAAGSPLPLDLAGSRATVAGWSAAATLMNGLMVYVCGRVSAAWRERGTRDHVRAAGTNG